MTNSDREFFVHCQRAKPQIIHAVLGDKLGDVLGRAGIESLADLHVFVGESDGKNDHDPVDPDVPLDTLDVQQRHVHCYPCPDVVVDVNFGGQTEQWKFSPATTIGVVTRQAHRKFLRNDAAASDYVLRLCGTNERQPRFDEYLGELVQASCSLCFDLVKEITPQG